MGKWRLGAHPLPCRSGTGYCPVSRCGRCSPAAEPIRPIRLITMTMISTSKRSKTWKRWKNTPEQQQTQQHGGHRAHHQGLEADHLAGRLADTDLPAGRPAVHPARSASAQLMWALMPRMISCKRCCSLWSTPGTLRSTRVGSHRPTLSRGRRRGSG